MTITDIDKQFSIIKSILIKRGEGNNHREKMYYKYESIDLIVDELIAFIKSTVKQAKAEQREETARIVANKIISEARKCRFEEEGQSFVTIGDLITVAGEVVDSIASEIRGQHD